MGTNNPLAQPQLASQDAQTQRPSDQSSSQQRAQRRLIEVQANPTNAQNSSVEHQTVTRTHEYAENYHSSVVKSDNFIFYFKKQYASEPGNGGRARNKVR